MRNLQVSKRIHGQNERRRRDIVRQATALPGVRRAATRSDQEVLVDVLAVGLHPRVRTGAAGTHYTTATALPMIPGIDGVGRRPDGRRVYFVAGDELPGPMADQAVVDLRRAIELPDGVDVAKVAAAMNPAMSSWVALRRRVPLEPGQSVLVLGATGSAGTMAVQIAKRLGAGRVVGAGRRSSTRSPSARSRSRRTRCPWPRSRPSGADPTRQASAPCSCLSR
jgi:NADPH:quinone reductase-like Zn-dependent oxidoreductase